MGGLLTSQANHWESDGPMHIHVLMMYGEFGIRLMLGLLL